MLLTTLGTKVEKNSQQPGYEGKQKGKKEKKKKEKVQENFSAAVVQKPSIMEEIPPEPIKRVNLTGLSDDQLFGPTFLY